MNFQGHFFFLASKKNRPKYQYVKKNFLKEKNIYIYIFFQLNMVKKNFKKKEKKIFSAQ
jgi:hypothetical protein